MDADDAEPLKRARDSANDVLAALEEHNKKRTRLEDKSKDASNAVLKKLLEQFSSNLCAEYCRS